MRLPGRPGTRFTASVAARGPVDPGEVWDRYVTPSRWTSWAPHLTGVATDVTTIAPGATGRVTALGVVPAAFVITEVDASAMRWSWQVRVGPIRLDLVHRVAGTAERTDVGGGAGPGPAATGTEVVITGPGWVVLPSLPIMKIALHRLVTEDC